MTPPSSGNGNGSAWRNYVIAVLTTLLLTSTGGWFAFARDSVSKTELAGELVPLHDAVKDLSTSVNGLTTAVAVMNTRLEVQRK